MRKPSIEDKIRDRLQGHSEEIDNDRLFDSLGISEEKEKKRVFFWLMGGIFIAAIFATAMYFIYNTEESITHTQITEDSVDEKYYTEEITGENQEIAEKSTPGETHQESLVFDDNNFKDLSHDRTESKKYSINDETNFLTVNPTQHTTTKSNVASYPVEDGIAGQKSNENTENVRLITSNNLPERHSSNSTVLAEKVNNTQQAEVAILDNQKQSIVNAERISTLGCNSLVEKELFDFGRKPQSLKVHKTQRWSIYLYGGISYFQQSYDPKLLVQNDAVRYALNRSESEKALEQLQAGIQWRYSINNKWSVGTGLQFTRFNSQHNYTENSKEIGIAEGISNITIDLYGDTTNIQRGTVESQFQILTRYTYYNSLDQWEIPISIWYSYPVGRLQFTAGLQWNTAFRTVYDGTLIDENNVRQNGDSYYNNTRILFSVEPTIGLNYRLDRNNSILLQTNYRQNLSSITNNNYILDHAIQSIGLRVGFQRMF